MKLNKYFQICSFELNGHFYEMLGVRFFKRFASSGDLIINRRRRSDPNFRIIKDYRTAMDWETRTKFNEVAHLANLLFNMIMIGWLCLKGRYNWIVPIIILNLLFNVFPILLQRYNRARIRRIQLLKDHNGALENR